MLDKQRIGELFDEALQPLSGVSDEGGGGMIAYDTDVRTAIIRAATMAEMIVAELAPTSPLMAELDRVVEIAHNGLVAPSTARAVIETAKWHFTDGLGAP